jgi:2-hydroxychromene-2-carboxylate isomerase
LSYPAIHLKNDCVNRGDCVKSVQRDEGSGALLPIIPSMGELILLSERLADRSRPNGEVPRFFFALDDPISYLSAERVERALGPIEWVPVLGAFSERDGGESVEERERHARERLALAEREAAALELPIVEPHRFPMDSRKAARAATFAADEGVGAAFAVALLRLAFCGGFDIGSMPVIEEAAAVAGLTSSEAVTAANDRRFDLRIDATSRGLPMRGVKSAPAINIGATWFQGTNAVYAAVAFSAAQGLMDAPQLPAG